MRFGSPGPAAPATSSRRSGFGAAGRQVHADTLEQSFEVRPDVRVEIELLSGKIELRGIYATRCACARTASSRSTGSKSGQHGSIRPPSSGWGPWGAARASTWRSSCRETVASPRAPATGRSRPGRGRRARPPLGERRDRFEGAPREAYLDDERRDQVRGRAQRGRGQDPERRDRAEGRDRRRRGQHHERADQGGGRRHRARRAATMSGEIELDASLAQGARVEAKSYSGQVRLRLPDYMWARFDVQKLQLRPPVRFLVAAHRRRERPRRLASRPGPPPLVLSSATAMRGSRSRSFKRRGEDRTGRSMRTCGSARCGRGRRSLS